MRLTKQACCPAPSVAHDTAGSITGNESFVTVNDDTATLPNSRQITAGAGISIVDGGPGNPITIANTSTGELEGYALPAVQWRPIVAGSASLQWIYLSAITGAFQAYQWPQGTPILIETGFALPTILAGTTTLDLTMWLIGDTTDALYGTNIVANMWAGADGSDPATNYSMSSAGSGLFTADMLKKITRTITVDGSLAGGNFLKVRIGRISSPPDYSGKVYFLTSLIMIPRG